MGKGLKVICKIEEDGGELGKLFYEGIADIIWFLGDVGFIVLCFI